MKLIVPGSENYGYGQKKLTAPSIVCNHTLTTEDDLSKNNVSCVVKDGDGFMRMGTSDDLNRFDGYSFVHDVK